MPAKSKNKKPPKSTARSSAMAHNQNAVKSESERVPKPWTLSLSLTHTRRERIRAAMEWHEGYVPEDNEVEEKARQLAYASWDAFYLPIERENENPIIT